MMTLEQLRIFVAVAEAMHVTRAARALNITQSAASAAIATLESGYATKLFHRIGRHIELSEAGAVLLHEARAVLARAAQAELVLADLAGLKQGALHLWASQTVANYWLPPMMHHYHQHYPQIALHLTIGNTAQVERAVQEGAGDLGIVEGDVDDPLLVRVPVEGDDLVLVVAPGHPWAALAGQAPTDLGETDWVTREPGSATRLNFEQAMKDHQVPPAAVRISLTLPSNEAVRSAVMAGAGAAILSRLVVDEAIASHRLSAVPLALPRRQFQVLRHGDRYRSRAAEAFLALVRRR